MAVNAKTGVAMGGTEKYKHEKVVHFDGIYPAPIDKLGVPGRWVRHMLLHWILSSTVLITRLQALRRPGIDTLMHIISFLGTEEFYTPIIVLLEWVVDTRLARLFTILMGAGFYFSTLMKNILRLPRPPSPPVEVLEVTSDWALPSLHAVIGVMLPWYICLYVYRHYQLTSWEIVLLVAIIFFWSTSVSVSRVYLGVHSPIDIIAGVIPGGIMLFTYVWADDYIDAFITSGNFVTVKAFLFYVTILTIHPPSGSPTSSYGETVITNSVAFGFVLATTRTVSAGDYYCALMEQAVRSGAPSLPSMTVISLALARIFLGFPMVLFTRVVFKPTTKMVIQWLCTWFNVEFYSYSDYSKNLPKLNKHHTAGFQLPPVTKKEKTHKHTVLNWGDGAGFCNGQIQSNSVTDNGTHQKVDAISSPSYREQTAFNIDTPTRFVTYTMMSWVATEWIHLCFHGLGLHLVSR